MLVFVWEIYKRLKCHTFQHNLTAVYWKMNVLNLILITILLFCGLTLVASQPRRVHSNSKAKVSGAVSCGFVFLKTFCFRLKYNRFRKYLLAKLHLNSSLKNDIKKENLYLLSIELQLLFWFILIKNESWKLLINLEQKNCGKYLFLKLSTHFLVTFILFPNLR